MLSFTPLSRRALAQANPWAWLQQRALVRAHRLLGRDRYRSFADLWSVLFDGPDFARQLKTLCVAHQIEVIWFILESHEFTGLFALRDLLEGEGPRVILNLHDPPLRLLERGCELASWLRPIFRRRLRQALQRCAAVAVASPEMARHYGCSGAEVLIHGHPLDQIRPPARRPKDPNRLCIGFVGTLYARQSWQRLLAALDEVDWKLPGRRVEIVFIGDDSKLPKQELVGRPIRLTGWLSTRECLEQLEHCDVGYLPYWFDQAEWVEVCFPSKVTSYLAAGIPVLYHGPRHSTPDQFLSQYPAGLCCPSLDAAEIRAALEQLLQPGAYAEYARQSHRAAVEQFNLEEFQLRVRRLLGCP
jgi:glycosyltransferase involved in cell wall biosynthesis